MYTINKSNNETTSNTQVGIQNDTDLKREEIKKVNLNALFLKLNEFLRPDQIIQNEPILSSFCENTVGVSREILGTILPESVEQVKQLVILANSYHIPLYPISCGKNRGYGDAAPIESNQLLVNLINMKKIIDYDPIAGEVSVEPGVTQKELAEYLKNNGGKYISDVTGASVDASILGNTLEAGFGHSPIGDRRKHLVEIQVVLGTGDVINSGSFPNLGPNVSGLFIQSNFGIITKIRIPLFLKPEKTEMFILKFKQTENFISSLSILHELRQKNVIKNLMHIGNATRALMSTSRFPYDTFKDTNVLTDEDCLKILNQNSGPIKAGFWTALGGFYGSDAEIKFDLPPKKWTLFYEANARSSAS